MKDLVTDWDNQLTILSTFAETQTQAAYYAFVSEFKNKLNFIMTIIPNVRHLPLSLEKAITNKFIPAVTRGLICNKTAEIEFRNSRKIISELTTMIKQQSLQYKIHKDNPKKRKTEIKKTTKSLSKTELNTK